MAASLCASGNCGHCAHPSRSAQPRFAPTAQHQPHLMPPVVGPQRHRALERGQAIRAAAGAFENHAQRGPRLGQVLIQPARLMCVERGEAQGLGIRLRIPAAGLELHAPALAGPR
ncbi:MAG: hypothetical protein U0P30_13855 [Vicinamibacterales bacterium]